MSKDTQPDESGPADSIQHRLAEYAFGLRFETLTPEAVLAAKIRVIDTLGALLSGFSAEPCRMARKVAMRLPCADGATIIGTSVKVAPEMAAFVNAMTARYVNFTDTYNWPGSAGGHPSDVIAPTLAVAEYAGRSGREFITGIVLAYETFLRLSDIFQNPGFDYTTFGGIGAAVGAAKMLGLSQEQLINCISIVTASNNTLRQTRLGQLSMWKAAASGEAGRAGVFAAILAEEGIEGPQLPFEGKAGWCDHVAGQRFALDSMGGVNTPFKVGSSIIKSRPAVGLTIASILAAEKVAPLEDFDAVDRVTVEVYKRALLACGSDANHWHPDSAETADHSIPYLVAVTLIDGTVTPSSYDGLHLRDARLRALMRKVVVVENEEFTNAYQQVPVEQCARVTVAMRDRRVQGEARYGAERPTEEEVIVRVSDKFRALTSGVLSEASSRSVLDCVLKLEDVKHMDDVFPMLTLKI